MLLQPLAHGHGGDAVTQALNERAGHLQLLHLRAYVHEEGDADELPGDARLQRAQRALELTHQLHRVGLAHGHGGQQRCPAEVVGLHQPEHAVQVLALETAHVVGQVVQEAGRRCQVHQVLKTLWLPVRSQRHHHAAH